MSRLFDFLQVYRSGIFVLLLVLGSIALLVQWLAWIFGIGRFGKEATQGIKAVSFIFSEAAVKIINEFRHFLALLVVVIFSFALGYSLIKAASLPVGADAPTVIDNMKEALQAVVATLGGLVGSIIGYYFGESSAVKLVPSTSDTGGTKPSAEVQNPPSERRSDETEKRAPAPPTSATLTGTDTPSK